MKNKRKLNYLHFIFGLQQVNRKKRANFVALRIFVTKKKNQKIQKNKNKKIINFLLKKF
jgi:hypothetical protein